MPTREGELSGEPDAIALRLLLCNSEVHRSEADEALGPRSVDDLIARGVLAERCGIVQSRLHMRTAQGLYLFSDYLCHENSAAHAVMGPGETTATLYRAGRPAGRIGRALDLGCGAGTLALLLASQADEAVGTDINPRAVELARFNASVNGIANATFHAGDMYEPVRGERFDCILSQPPYYPSKPGAQALTFLHGGPRGDELAMRVVEGAPHRLTAAGRALIFTSWPEDREPIALAGHNVFELHTNRRELHGTRQSITVIQRGEPGWTASLEVPADCWGFLHHWRLDQLIAGESLLRSGGPLPPLRLTAGVTPHREGADLFLNGPAESLVRFAPVDEETWTALRAIDAGGPSDGPIAGDALRRGLLRPA